MKTFYFDTGVTPHGHSNPPMKLEKGEVWRGGTKQVPFDCDNVPENASFMFACDNPELGESKYENVIVREIFNSSLCSKYAYFKVLT